MMMTHVDEGVLQALADGELSGDELRVAERHLDSCSSCRAELELLRSASLELSGALSLLDRPTPRKRIPLPAVSSRRTAPRTLGMSWGLARAAMLVLGFTAAASATIPGSPVRAWLGDLLSPEPQVAAVTAPSTRAAESQPPEATLAMESATETPAEAGISVMPAGGTVRIFLRNASPDLQVQAVVVDRPRAGVYARGDASTARFSTGPGRIEVDGAGAGELRIELPRSAHSATVEVNGRRYLTKEGDQIRLAVPAQHSSAQEFSFKVQP